MIGFNQGPSICILPDINTNKECFMRLWPAVLWKKDKVKISRCCCLFQVDGLVVADCDSGEICVCEDLEVHPLPERHATNFRDSCKKLQHQFELVALER